MAVYLVTVADDRFGRKGGRYLETQRRVQQFFAAQASFGVKVLSFTWDDIQQSQFYRDNKAQLDDPDPDHNGRPYKAWAVLQALNVAQEGDFVIYNDASPEVWELVLRRGKIDTTRFSLDVLKSTCLANNGILSAHVPFDADGKNVVPGAHTHENFTRPHCLEAMQATHLKDYLQHASSFLCLQKTPVSVAFVEAWLDWNTVPACYYLPGPQWVEALAPHRFDQSISSLVLLSAGHTRVVLTTTLNDMHTYNFLQWCRKGFQYEFIDCAQPQLNYTCSWSKYDGMKRYLRG